MSTDMFDLKGKVALVTGGGSGIGRAMAIGLAEAGADVAILGRRQSVLDETAQSIETAGGQALVIQQDLTQTSQIPRAVDQVVAKLGGLHILINSAGAQITGPSVDVDEAAWDTHLNVMLKAAFFSSQAAARHFLSKKQKGKIINMASTFSVVGFPQFAAYCAAKGGVMQMTKALAAEWAKEGINVNAIAPAGTRTELNAYLFDDSGFLEGFLPMMPAGRICQPADMVGAAIYLASGASDMVHGHTLFVDGGFTII